MLPESHALPIKAADAPSDSSFSQCFCRRRSCRLHAEITVSAASTIDRTGRATDLNEAITKPGHSFLSCAAAGLQAGDYMNSTMRTACAGAVAGLAGTFAMNVAQRLWSLAAGDRPPESAAGPHDARDWQEREEAKNSNELAAQALASVVGIRLTDRQLAAVAPVVHFSFGAAVGAVYSIYVDRRRGDAPSGLELGGGLWLTADEIAMPVLGLSRSTLQRSPEKHLQSLAAHFVYGVVTEQVRRVAVRS